MIIKITNRKIEYISGVRIAMKATKKGPLRFVIHKHDATNLHYDLRLEMNGTMVSWAVPKGPSLDPNLKRLARRVTDHPISYNSFEGTLPLGSYGAGEVIIWDHGTYESIHTEDREESEKEFLDGLEDGRLVFKLKGIKLTGKFFLYKWKGNSKNDNWLLMKVKDESATEEDIRKDARSVVTGKILIGKREKLTA